MFVWRNLGFGIFRLESGGCCKHQLVGHTSRSMENSGAKSYLNYERLTQEVSREEF